MSKRKPDAVFSVTLTDLSEIIVLARHAKGALSVAKAHGYQTTNFRPPREMDEMWAKRAINGKKAKHEAAE